MKKVFTFFLSCWLIFAIVSCSGNNETSSTKKPQNIQKATGVPTVSPTLDDTDATETPATTKVPKADNLLPGGDFTKLDSMWGTYMESDGDGSIAVNTDGQLEVTINNNGTVKHAMQVYCDGFELLQNAKYELSFDIKATVVRTMDWRFQINGGDYHAYASGEGVKITTDMQHLTYEFTMKEASDKTPRFCFNLGLFEEGKLAPHTVYLDNVKLKLKDDSNTVTEDAGKKEVAININQVGYLSTAVKTAVFRDSAADTEFNVVDAKSGKIVYTGQITGAKDASSAGEKVAYGDFSQFTTSGTYKITAKNAGESSAFVIGNDVYKNLFDDTVKMLYLQRCGSKLTKDYAGDFAHSACHTEEATIYGTKEKKDVSGGWHDAGDYGRYVVSGAKAVADLLLAFEDFGSVFGDDTGIPESGNKVPDVLDEARYELEWLLKMQDNTSGGVHHKVTGLNFEGNIVMPQEVKDEQFIMPISTCATGDFSAVMAMASRVYKKYDASFAKKCLEASKSALGYMEKNLGQAGYTNPHEVKTGEYGDSVNKDEYLWALCELYKTTEKPEYQSKISSIHISSLEDGLGWMGVNLYGYYAYLTSKNQDYSLASNIKNEFKSYLITVKGNIATDGYHSSMGATYPWGSNMTIANNGMALFMANKVLQKEDINTKMAKEQLDYLLGVNTTSYCFVTGYGTINPVSTHHRPSQALKTTMKGMLVGGPNSNLEDPFAKTVLAGLPAAKCYADNSQSYSCNEVTIYWNSPLVYLLAGIQAGK